MPPKIYVGDVIQFHLAVTDAITAANVDLTAFDSVSAVFSSRTGGFTVAATGVSVGACVVQTQPGQLSAPGEWRLQLVGYTGGVVYAHSSDWGFQVYAPV